MDGGRLIGIDVGTTAVKALMMDLDGRPVARFARSYPARRPRPGWVEQDPEDWLRLVRAALAGFAAEPGAGSVLAIGVTSQVNTHVFADAALRPLRPAIVWQDTRAAGHAVALDAMIAPADRVAWFGGPTPIDASNAVARMAWAAAEAPDDWAATAQVLSPKDWCLARLTGAVAADPIASVGLVGQDLRYVDGLLALVPGAAERLPRLADPLTIVGRMRPGEPFAGVEVALGTMDAWAGMFGVGATAEGQGFHLGGTSEVLGLLSAAVTPTPGVVVFAPWRGLRLHAAPTQAGGASLDWAARLVERPAEAVAALAAQALRPGAPLFLPHLEGERAPFWDPLARGAFAGLGAADGPEAVAAAVLEGVALSAGLAFEAAAASAGVRPAVVRAGGGGMRADAWCQLRADVLGLPLARVAAPEAGALGAALMAGAAAGLFPSLDAAAARLVRVDRTFEPDPARHAVATERLALFRLLYERLGPINARLAEARERQAGCAGMLQP